MVDQVSARVRTLVDGALDRVFDEPFDVRTAAELEDLVAAGPIGNGPGPAATSLGAFVAAAMPLARRALIGREQVVEGRDQGRRCRRRRRSRSDWPRSPSRCASSTTTRRGVRELQLLASYVITRLRAAGVDPDRGLVRSLTLSLYVDPARRPNARRARLAHRRRGRPAVGAAVARRRRRERGPGPRPAPGRGHRPPRPPRPGGRLGPPRRD